VLINRMNRLQTACITIPALNNSGNVADLINALIGVSGIAYIAVDPTSQTLSVEYDPDYLDTKSLDFFINGAGYLVAITQDEPRP